jgi:hypothetical protein
MISGGLFRQTSNRGGDFFFCSKRSHGNPFFDHRVGYREIGVDGIGSIKHSGSTRGEVMGKLAASNLMEEKLFPSQ